MVSKRRGGAQVRMSAVRKVTLPAVTRWRASAIISGAASIAVMVVAQPARCRVHIPVPQAISNRSPPGRSRRARAAIRPSAPCTSR
jgi:hypothetical protein